MAGRAMRRSRMAQAFLLAAFLVLVPACQWTLHSTGFVAPEQVARARAASFAPEKLPDWAPAVLQELANSPSCGEKPAVSRVCKRRAERAHQKEHRKRTPTALPEKSFGDAVGPVVSTGPTSPKKKKAPVSLVRLLPAQVKKVIVVNHGKHPQSPRHLRRLEALNNAAPFHPAPHPKKVMEASEGLLSVSPPQPVFVSETSTSDAHRWPSTDVEVLAVFPGLAHRYSRRQYNWRWQ